MHVLSYTTFLLPNDMTCLSYKVKISLYINLDKNIYNLNHFIWLINKKNIIYLYYLLL